MWTDINSDRYQKVFGEAKLWIRKLKSLETQSV